MRGLSNNSVWAPKETLLPPPPSEDLDKWVMLAGQQSTREAVGGCDCFFNPPVHLIKLSKMTDCDMWPTSSENCQQILVSRLFIIQINDHRSRRRRHRDISQRVKSTSRRRLSSDASQSRDPERLPHQRETGFSPAWDLVTSHSYRPVTASCCPKLIVLFCFTDEFNHKISCQTQLQWMTL